MYKILLIEDDEVISTKMRDFLTSWGYEVETIKDFYHVMEQFHAFSPHLILMDISLPYLNGFLWTEQIRKESKIPIIFVSSADDNMNIVLSISKGADDYITKPFDLQVLAAKVQAILRRTYNFSSSQQNLEYKGLQFSMDDYTMTYQDQSLELSKNEAKILYLLMKKKGQVVSRDALMDHLWNTDSYVDENTLNVNVNRLRKKLESIGLSNFIQTKKGVGYKL